MKKMILAATALSLMAAPAFAAPVTGTVNLSGTVNAKCSPSSGGATTVTIPVDLSNADGTLNTGAVNAITASVTGSGVCNGVNTFIELDASPLVGSVAVPSGATAFANVINYTAVMGITGYAQGGNTWSNSTTAAATTGVLGLVNATAVSLDINDAALPGSATLLVAGTYTGSVTVKVTPAV
jgi:hypothetical protein